MAIVNAPNVKRFKVCPPKYNPITAKSSERGIVMANTNTCFPAPSIINNTAIAKSPPIKRSLLRSVPINFTRCPCE